MQTVNNHTAGFMFLMGSAVLSYFLASAEGASLA